MMCCQKFALQQIIRANPHTRSNVGNLNGFHNVCRHRGSLLVLEDGRYPVISCPYHRWGYSLDGRLLATPMWDMGPDGKTKNKSARKKKREENKKKLEELLSFADIQKVEDDAEKFQNCEQMNAITKVFTPQGDFDKKDYPLFKVRVETWGPYVFATKDENAPRIDEYLGDMVEHLGDHPLDELVVVREKTFKPEANWKLLMENFMEYYHLPAVHPELCLVSGVEERMFLLSILSMLEREVREYRSLYLSLSSLIHPSHLHTHHTHK